MKYLKLFEELSHYTPLYHSLKLEYAFDSLNSNKIGGYTHQRYWENGIRLKDDHIDYNNSFYLKGLSLTRDISYAKKWNSVIFEFDSNLLKQKYKLIPFNWGYSIGNGYKQRDIKREREEFLITGRIAKKLTNNQLVKMHDIPKGYLEPLDKYLTGIYIDQYIVDLDEHNDMIGYLVNHEKFKGLF